ncbi:5625_t:CDS:2, partial [Acaulospora colombiana]
LFIHNTKELPALESLDLRQMKRLTLKGLPFYEVVNLMELVYRVNRRQLAITIDSYVGDMSSVLEHSLIKRAIDLKLDLKSEEIFYGTNISVPQLRSLELYGDQGTLNAFNLQNLKNLKIWWNESFGLESLTMIPIRLTTLSLRNMVFSIEKIENQDPHFLPDLVTLCLKETNLEAPLQRIFQVPQLKHLEIDEMTYRYQDIGTDLTPDVFFSPRLLNLECLVLLNVLVDESFIMEIQGYTNLKRLSKYSQSTVHLEGLP